ncbi:hypothetical protein D8S78_18820 [Natrialba swarupiae]|nr:hypothetical protein [Natrialba swarupiae]
MFALALVTFGGTITAFGGLIAIILGRLRIRSALCVTLSLVTGSLSLLSLLAALVGGSLLFAFVTIGCGVVAGILSVAAYAKPRDSSGRFVPPI